MEASILIAVRLGLYVSLGLLAGMPLYNCLVARDSTPIARSLIFTLSVAGIVLSGLWLLATAAAMGGTPLSAPDWPTLGLVLSSTGMGWALMLRVAVLVLVILLPPRPMLLALPASMAMATLAWSGHAAASEGLWGNVHMASDILHMLAAAVWLAALLRFLRGVMRHGASRSITLALSEFAWAGTIIVAVLIVTGLYNLTMIAGLDLLLKPPLSPYGQLLAAKLMLFAVMLGLAAANRWLFTPAMRSGARTGVNGIRISLTVESAFLLAILSIVAIMGTLDPQP